MDTERRKRRGNFKRIYCKKKNLFSFYIFLFSQYIFVDMWEFYRMQSNLFSIMGRIKRELLQNRESHALCCKSVSLLDVF